MKKIAKKSAYFPTAEKSNEDDKEPFLGSITGNSRAVEESSGNRASSSQNHTGTVSGSRCRPPIHFPSQRSVLWDRSTFSECTTITPESVLPTLRISLSNIKGIVKLLYSNRKNYSTSQLMLRAQFVNTNALSEDEKSRLDMLGKKRADPERFVFSIFCEPELLPSENVLSIPVSMRNTGDNSMSFDGDLTRNLQGNLLKALAKGKSFSLRSCIRLRAAARAYSSEPNGGSSAISVLRIEAITPNVALKAVQIGTIPIYATSTSGKLLEDKSTTNMGHITLNQTRQLVLLPSCKGGGNQFMDTITTPVVGIWISMPSISKPHDFFTDRTGLNDESSRCPLSVLENAYIWGACVKYIFSDYIDDKVWIAPSTFLLALFTSFGAFNFEITKMISEDSNQPSIESIKFISHDITADLNAEVFHIGRFDTNDDVELRPTSRFSILGQFRRVCNGRFSEESSADTIGSESEKKKGTDKITCCETSCSDSMGTKCDVENENAYSSGADFQGNAKDIRAHHSSRQGLFSASSDSIDTTQTREKREEKRFENLEKWSSNLENANCENEYDQIRSDANRTISENREFVSMEAYMAQQQELELLRKRVAELEEELRRAKQTTGSFCNEKVKPEEQSQLDTHRPDTTTLYCSDSRQDESHVDTSLRHEEGDTCDNKDSSETSIPSKEESDSYCTVSTYTNVTPLEPPSLMNFDSLNSNFSSSHYQTKRSNPNSHKAANSSKYSPLEALLATTSSGTAALSSQRRSVKSLPFAEPFIDVINTKHIYDGSGSTVEDNETESMLNIEAKYLKS